MRDIDATESLEPRQVVEAENSYRAANRLETASTAMLEAKTDPLQVALAQEWHRRVGAVLHAHHCARCGLLRACLADPCPYRATELEREWECGCQVTQLVQVAQRDKEE